MLSKGTIGFVVIGFKSWSDVFFFLSSPEAWKWICVSLLFWELKDYLLYSRLDEIYFWIITSVGQMTFNDK